MDRILQTLEILPADVGHLRHLASILGWDQHRWSLQALRGWVFSYGTEAAFAEFERDFLYQQHGNFDRAVLVWPVLGAYIMQMKGDDSRMDEWTFGSAGRDKDHWHPEDHSLRFTYSLSRYTCRMIEADEESYQDWVEIYQRTLQDNTWLPATTYVLEIWLHRWWSENVAALSPISTTSSVGEAQETIARWVRESSVDSDAEDAIQILNHAANVLEDRYRSVEEEEDEDLASDSSDEEHNDSSSESEEAPDPSWMVLAAEQSSVSSGFTGLSQLLPTPGSSPASPAAAPHVRDDSLFRGPLQGYRSPYDEDAMPIEDMGLGMMAGGATSVPRRMYIDNEAWNDLFEPYSQDALDRGSISPPETQPVEPNRRASDSRFHIQVVLGQYVGGMVLEAYDPLDWFDIGGEEQE